jgi:hypothetical protein
LKHNDTFVLGYNHAAERHHVLAAHHLADDRKSILAHVVVGYDVVGTVEVPLINLVARHKRIDVDRVRSLNCDGIRYPPWGASAADLRVSTPAICVCSQPMASNWRNTAEHQ